MIIIYLKNYDNITFIFVGLFIVKPAKASELT